MINANLDKSISFYCNIFSVISNYFIDCDILAPSIFNYINSDVSNLQANPIFIAVSILSPVLTQILIPASLIFLIVSPT